MSEEEQRGPYRLVTLIARGGMGEVWEAVHVERGGPAVALKTVRTDESDVPLMRRLLDEAVIGALLQHDHVVRTLDVGLEGGAVYLVMERLRGATLARLHRGPAPPGLVVALGLQVLEGLAYAHAARGPDGQPLGLVHRDIKPSNLFVTDEGVLKLIDFGIARALPLARTATGSFRGSLPYASPEQARNETLDGRSDLFAVGLVLHELLTGRRVFDHESEAAVLSAILWDPVVPVRARRGDVPPALDGAVCAALARDRDQRPASAAAFAAALREAVPAAEVWTRAQIAGWVAERQAALRQATPEGVETVAARPSSAAARAQAAARRRRAWLLPLAGGAVLLAATLGVALDRSPEPPVPVRLLPGDVPAPVAAAPASPPVSAPVRAPDPRPPPGGQGRLTVTVRAGWAQVLLDGRSLGTSPIYRQAVPGGPHVVEAVFPNGSRERKAVAIEPGEVLTISLGR